MKRRTMILVALGIALALLTGWLMHEPRGRAEDVLQRRGNLAQVALGPMVAEAGGFVSQDVRLQSDSGLRVALKVLRPDANETTRRPLAVMLGGHRTGRDAVGLLGSPGSLAVAALDYPYDGPERVRGWRQALAVVGPARRAVGDTPAAVLLALEWLAQQPWVDVERVELVGVSLGVPFVTVAGAIEPRFRRVWLIHGGADLKAWLSHNLERSIASPVLRTSAARVVSRLVGASRYEPAHWAPQIAPRPTIIIGASDDRRLPRTLVEQLAAAAGEPKQLRWTQGDHVDRQPETIRHLVDLVLEHVEDDDP